MSGLEPRPIPAIFGCAGLTLSEAERALFAQVRPAGFILFARNISSAGQTRSLIDALVQSASHDQVLMLVDQEGGRVARLGPPEWRAWPAAAEIAALYAQNIELGLEGAHLLGRLIADDLQPLGFNVDCAPVLDVPAPGGHPIIGDRAFGTDPKIVDELAGAVADGLLAGGVLPVIKHIPGHGRADVDSHAALPVVSAPLAELEKTDFQPFSRLAHLPCAMTAHVTYDAIDPALPATLSPEVIGKIIRDKIGFAGLLMSDDLHMSALSGTPAARAVAAIGAGCDIALYCQPDLAAIEDISRVLDPMSGAGWDRFQTAFRTIALPDGFDRAAAEARFDGLMAGIEE